MSEQNSTASAEIESARPDKRQGHRPQTDKVKVKRKTRRRERSSPNRRRKMTLEAKSYGSNRARRGHMTRDTRETAVSQPAHALHQISGGKEGDRCGPEKDHQEPDIGGGGERMAE
jgi:hypothetical protein